MKTNTKLAVASLLLVAVLNAAAQVASNVTFTKITTGAIVTDSAYSIGCAWGDYDSDGYLDLVVGNALGDANALYHNNGNGTFTRITTNPIATIIGDADGTVWGDYDNDGDLDLFVANYRLASFLFRNDGDGNFTRVNQGSMVSNVGDSLGCAWGDYDNDGFLDLVVANETGQNAFLYRNDGDSSFAQIFSGSVPTSPNTVCPHWADYDNDGRLDLFLSRNTTNGLNILHHNAGEPVFFTAASGLPTGDIGTGSGDWGDYDNDGDLDFISPYWRGGGSVSAVVYRNDGNGSFTRIGLASILSGGGSFFGALAVLGDYDNDGWLDLFLHQSESGNRSRFLFHNNGDGTFTRITNGMTSDVSIPVGAGWADYDNDGFLDLFIANGGTVARQPSFLYHNEGNNNRWLSIKCVGAASNRSGIGAKVRVQAKIAGITRRQLREINSGNGYNGGGLRAHFGLGDATNVDLVRIEWPSGTVQEFQDVAVNRFLTLTEPPRLQAVGRLGDGSFDFHLTGGIGSPYLLETSTNLVVWIEWMAVTNTTRTMLINDWETANAPNRFYRVLPTGNWSCPPGVAPSLCDHLRVRAGN